MRVTLLGTGAAEGWPGLFCRCEACLMARETGGKNIRTRSSSLIDGTLKIDFPPDMLHQVIANNLDLREMKALLFTHAHDDHFSGSELQYLGPYFVTEKLAESLSVYGPPEVIDWLTAHLNVDRLPLTLHTLTPWKTVCIDRYQVTPLLAQHDPTTTCFNYLIEDRQGTTLLYATDTGWYDEATWQFLRNYSLDGIVVECQKGLEEDGYQGHLSIADVIRMRQRLIESDNFAPERLCVVTHLSHLTGLAHTDWETRLLPYNIQTGYDGMTLDVPPPSPAERRLRRLQKKNKGINMAIIKEQDSLQNSSSPGQESELNRVAILLREGDEVAVAKMRIPAGDVIVLPEGTAIRLNQTVPPGHKFALTGVAEGGPVHKYGQVIGYATRPILAGDWVHTQNLGFGKSEHAGAGALTVDYELSTDIPQVAYYPAALQRTFPGFARADGRVGTRNYVALVSTVNCSASTVRAIADHFRSPDALKDFPGVDGVMPMTHKSGCGQATGTADYVQLQRTLSGMADHPNVGAYLLAGLGCEVNQAMAMAHNGGLISAESLLQGRPQLPPMITIQEAGGIQKTIALGIEETVKLLKKASQARRTSQSISSLIVGTNCGGSDGNSGVTANPALGMAGDEFVRHGAGWVLAETSETYGAEHLLTRRAVTPEVGQKLIALMRWWEWYTGVWGATIDGNPSPGNKEGGLTTIYEKSLGAVSKAGTTPLVEVYKYGERIGKKGLTFMDTPGHDPVSVTGLAAGGCNLIVFTTGRGSCLGFKPTPVLKIATNSTMYHRLEDDMDIDAGVIMDGVPIADVGRQVFEALIAVAGGQKTKSEAQGLGEDEFAPWLLGPVM